MWHYPRIDPVALQLGPVAIHWYALSYLVGIGVVWWLLKRNKGDAWTDEQISDLIFYGVLGIVVGGRLGYMLFYGYSALLENPLSLLKVWQGGMSFHGGMLGVITAVYLYARKHNRRFLEIGDFIAPSVPLALGSGRIGNFINGELPGRIADVPWAVIYPGDTLGRHPSSLYQALLEGPVLFAALWLFTRKPRPLMAVSGFFLTGYGSLRVLSEFFREPDQHMGFIAFGWITAGQLLSLPMVIIGGAFLVYGYRRQQ
jgi:phosphatidylglycerol---prolipoprotein diacylglyceryl transferase